MNDRPPTAAEQKAAEAILIAASSYRDESGLIAPITIPWRALPVLAAAAIRSLREPTSEMIAAGENVGWPGYEYADPKRTYEAMVDAASPPEETFVQSLDKLDEVLAEANDPLPGFKNPKARASLKIVDPFSPESRAAMCEEKELREARILNRAFKCDGLDDTNTIDRSKWRYRVVEFYAQNLHRTAWRVEDTWTGNVNVDGGHVTIEDAIAAMQRLNKGTDTICGETEDGA